MKVKKVIIALFWIILLSLTGFGTMILISPEAKALPIFLIVFFVALVVIVLIALYINYAVNIYKQIRED
ncbi:MAG: hypothetical protein DRI95_04560 [Bacteroidetes bacterium]|nr:MAG: hypothetical protein DRI95_04560 [Bacteroidota bacterium]